VGYFKVTLLCSFVAAKKHSPPRPGESKCAPGKWLHLAEQGLEAVKNTRHARGKSANIGHIGRRRGTEVPPKRQTKQWKGKAMNPENARTGFCQTCMNQWRQRLAGEKKKLVSQRSERHDKTSPHENAYTSTTPGVTEHKTN